MATLGQKSVGAIVKLYENGNASNYIVVHQGNPDSSIYDSSCTGTWLLRQDIAEERQWDNGNENILESSQIHRYLRDTWINRYDSAIQSAIKQAIIPYREDGGYGTDADGADGLSCKVFLLSAREVGLTNDNTHDYALPVDGAKLSYFLSGNSSSANQKRIAQFSGAASDWATRSPMSGNDNYEITLDSGGDIGIKMARVEIGIRPALILPTDLFVSDAGIITENTVPSTPGSITVPNTITEGDTITVSWAASTDAEGNLSGYKLEKSTNNGSSWSQIYQGSARSHSDTVTTGTTQVCYRVKAYDSEGLESGYRTSSNVSVNRKPTITCSTASGGNLGEKSADFSVQYTVNDADNDDVTVTEQIDGVTKKTYTATLGSAAQFAVTGETFMTLLNGSHVLKITANDGNASADYTLNFTKKVNAASITLDEPMEADAAITACALSIEGSIPDDSHLVVKVTNNANDTSPVWEDCTNAVKQGHNHVFSNQTATNGFAFNFKIEVSRGLSNTGGYITSVQGGFR